MKMIGGKKVLELKHVSMSVENGSDQKRILNDMNIKFEKGKFYAVTGPNGGGKTSLAKVAMGIYQHQEGKIIWQGEDISHKTITERARMGLSYAFQQPPRFKGLEVHDLFRIANPDITKKEISLLLKNVGLCAEEYYYREVDTRLSGGEMKRIEIGNMLARKADLVIYDEPEAGVDLWTFEQLIKVISSEHQSREMTTIIITHNERFLQAADEIILLADGEIKERGNADKIWPLIKDEMACKWCNTCGGDPDGAECN